MFLPEIAHALNFFLLNTWTCFLLPPQLHNLGSAVNFVHLVSELWVTCRYDIWTQTSFRLPLCPSCWPVLTRNTAGPIAPRPGSLPLQREQWWGGLFDHLWGLGQGRSFLCSPSFTSRRPLQEIMMGTGGFLCSLYAKFVTSLCGVTYWDHLIEPSWFSSDYWWVLALKLFTGGFYISLIRISPISFTVIRYTV